MSESDPFSAYSSDRTVIKPGAGRGRPAGAASSGGLFDDAQGDAGSPLDGVALPELPSVAGFNPLLQAATPLLRAAPRIRAMAQHPNPGALRAALIEGVRQFETEARAAGLPNEQVVAARYILCTFLDEAASRTPWGGSGSWSTQSLLIAFHSETWGGEKVFQLLGKLAEDVPRHRNLLELMSVVLALGFQGRYGVIDTGAAQLDGVRDRLSAMLRQGVPAPEKELSPHWAGAPMADARLRDGVPVWMVAAVAAFALMLVFIGLRFAIEGRSDKAFTALQGLDVQPSRAAPAAPLVVAATPRLSGFLKPDIDAGLVEVRDYADRSVVVIKGDGLFEAGSAVVTDRVRPLMGRISDALDKVPGSVLVSGHTDNQPIRSVRFPSNWELSKERALAVATMLAGNGKSPRIKAEGRADGEPVADNETPAGRSRNRRVEITLMSPQA